MSSRRKNTVRKEHAEIDLCQVVKFLRLIGVMVGALLLVAIVGFIFSDKTPETNVVYAIVISVNSVVTLVSLLIPIYFEKREREIELEREQISNR